MSDPALATGARAHDHDIGEVVGLGHERLLRLGDIARMLHVRAWMERRYPPIGEYVVRPRQARKSWPKWRLPSFVWTKKR